jgi:two-component system, NarL family, sensor kinase
MIRLIFCATWCMISLCTSCQEIDSLKAVMHSSRSYTDRIKAYRFYLGKYILQNFDDAISIGEDALALARKNGDSVVAGELKREIGEAWYFKGKYDVAANYFYESISILEKINNKVHLANSYNALAKLYRKTRDLKRSLENYEKAMDLFRSLNDSAGISMIYNESGVVFEYSGNYNKAIDRYSASLKIAQRRNDSVGICYALSNLAGVYTLQNRFAEAENYLRQTLTIRKKLKDIFTLALSYSDLGSTYTSAGAYEKAKVCLDSSNAIANKMGYPELKRNNYELLSQIAEKQGNYQLALDYFHKRTGLQDSIFGIEKTKQIEELNTRYETEKKERMIHEQQNKLARQKIIIGSVVALVVLVTLLAFTQYRRYKWKQEAKMRTAILKQQEEAMKAVIEAEEAERQRIAKDLHDGVGQMMSAAKMNLSAYESNVFFKDEEEKLNFENIIALVDESCKEVRSVSHNMMPNALLKNSLASAIREFIDKLPVRTGTGGDQKKLQVHLYTEGLEERLEANVETVLYRVIQECVNNVIKHANANTLDISIIKDANEITATIEDNGKGFDTSDKEKFDGIGLKNIRTRVEYLKGTVDFDSMHGKGTLVALHVPL